MLSKRVHVRWRIKKTFGLRHVTLHNCEIGDDVLIENVPNYIANYRIGNDSFIQNVNILVVDGKSKFGNGTEVSVLNETGGRKFPFMINYRLIWLIS